MQQALSHMADKGKDEGMRNEVQYEAKADNNCIIKPAYIILL